MGETNRNDDMNGHGTVKARLDLVAQFLLAAVRVDYGEQPPCRVGGDRGPGRTDTETRQQQRGRGRQANNDRGRDREADPTKRRRVDDERNEERSDGKGQRVEARTNASFAFTPEARRGGVVLTSAHLAPRGSRAVRAAAAPVEPYPGEPRAPAQLRRATDSCGPHGRPGARRQPQTRGPRSRRRS